MTSSIKDLGNQLKEEMERLLIDSDIRHIHSYGWQSEDEIDPKYFGHALWQMKPPIDHAFEIDFDNRPSEGFGEREKELMILGTDFEGVMIAGRSAVGDILFYSECSTDFLPTMDLNIERSLLHALMDLNIASDRIKEFFIWAFWRISPNDFYKKKDIKNASWYTTPFREACRQISSELDPKNVRLIENLDAVSKAIYDFRTKRNAVVHEITSSIARNEKHFLEDSPSNKENSNTLQLNFAEVRRQQKLVVDLENRLHSIRVELVLGFYKTLIRMSSDIFELEFNIR